MLAVIFTLICVSFPVFVEAGKIGGGLGAFCLDDVHCTGAVPNTACINETCVCDAANGYVEAGGGGGELAKRSLTDELNPLVRKKRGDFQPCIKDCGIPSAATGYVINSYSDTYEGTPADFSCDSGYSGSDGTITCQSSGLWEEFSGCLINCSSPSAETGYILGAVASTLDGSTVAVTCDSGYGGLGGTITCQSSGSWSAASGCSIDCGSPSTSTGYTLTHVTSTLEGDKVPFVCDSSESYCGHAGTIKCQSDGSWTNFHGCNHDTNLCSGGRSYQQTFGHFGVILISASFTLTL